MTSRRPANRFFCHVWACLFLFGAGAAPLFGVDSPLRQDAYIWQRSWNDPLRVAVKEHGNAFSNLVVLNAEVSWKNNSPVTKQIALDYEVLSQAHARIGLALRINPYSGNLSETGQTSALLASLAASLVAACHTHQIEPGELQLDFDCASSKLADYARLAHAIRDSIAPTPLIITALPDWLGRPNFEVLLKETDGYILQVHSLERPRVLASNQTLCDSNSIVRWVETASRLRTPFRVALPTYSYLLASDSSGRLVGLSAEGPQKSWTAGTQVRLVKTDTALMANFVNSWAKERPRQMEGIIWYRFPVAADHLNLRWSALEAVMQGRVPQNECRAMVVKRGSLLEIVLVNTGEEEFQSPVTVRLDWDPKDAPRPEASDALSGLDLIDLSPSSLLFTSLKTPISVLPGDQRTIGWIRFARAPKVTVTLNP